METYTCNKCRIEKNISLEFFRFAKKENRWFKICRDCERKSHRKYLKKTNYYHENKSKIKAKNKENYYKNIDQRTEYHKEYYQKNKKQIIKRVQKYTAKNKDKIKKYQSEYKKNRSKKDPVFKMRNNVSKTIRFYLKKNKSSKKSSVWNYLPYSPKELKKHLESQFEPWMNWNNYGSLSSKEKTWQIDHIIPQSKLPYDSLDHPNFIKCWNLNNLRPLEAIKNLKKNNK